MARKLPSYEEMAQVVKEVTGGDLTPEMAEEVLNRDMAPIANDWRNMSTNESLALETIYGATGDREKAVGDVLQKWDTEIGKPRKIVEIGTNRDIYNALKEVYDRSGGDWEMVAKVARYNDVPKELMDEFVKDGKWTDYSVAEEFGSGTGAVLRGAVDNLYGGIANALTGGKYSEEFTREVPRGIEYDDMAHTLWRAGINQTKDYHRSMMETDPGMEIAGQIVGSFVPIGLASKATKGLKVVKGASEATKAGKIANTFARGAATGGLYSIPGSLAEESLGDALLNTGENALAFGAGDVAFSGLGAALGATKNALGRASKKFATAPENYVKAFEKIKPVSEMSEAELKRGIEKGWLSADGKVNVSKYLAEEYGMEGTDVMKDLIRASKGNREVYNQLVGELKNFDYKKSIIDASKNNMLKNAPLNRVNQVLKKVPEMLEDFGNKIVEYTGGEEGLGDLIKSMKAFNDDVAKKLGKAVGGKPTAIEKKMIDKYLKDVETANMQQMMKKGLPTEYQVVDKNPGFFREFGRVFNITNPISAVLAGIKGVEARNARNYMRQVMAGQARKASSPLQKMLERIGKATDQTVSDKTAEKAKQITRAVAGQMTKE